MVIYILQKSNLRNPCRFCFEPISHISKIGVQCKRFKSSVSNKAVQETFAGRHYYDCDRAIVVTPSVFTRSAKNLADKLNIELIDGQKLDKILLSIQEYLLNKFYKHEKSTEILNQLFNWPCS
ncbi:restriction endonuclease [Diaphorobacter sp. DS2]|nr:restriction endonuclease [Diaphorobacter sp. DS2]